MCACPPTAPRIFKQHIVCVLISFCICVFLKMKIQKYSTTESVKVCKYVHTHTLSQQHTGKHTNTTHKMHDLCTRQPSKPRSQTHTHTLAPQQPPTKSLYYIRNTKRTI